MPNTDRATSLSLLQQLSIAATPSPWIVRWSGAIAPHGRVLDLACGSGRHVQWLAGLGLRVTALDRDADALARCTDATERIQADLEAAPWPLPGRRFDAVIVTNYLWRALMPQIVGSVDAGGLLLYETFARGNERYGKPSNPDYLLQPGELLTLAQGLHVLAFEDGTIEAPARRVQRLAAWRGDALRDLPPLLASAMPA
jgi:SAM-dependent methyltransferase